MEAFLHYVRKFRTDLGFRGADEAALAELQACYARPLPRAYLDFLSVMGADPAWFCLLGDAHTDIASVVERTRDMAEDGLFAHLLDTCVIIGSQHGISEDLALEESPGREPRVVSADVSVLYTVARTLRHLLMRQAFVVAQREHPLRRHWSGRSSLTRAEFEAEATRLGFEALWFSDEQGWCAERPGARLRVSSFDGDPLGVSLAAEDPAWIAHFDHLCSVRWALKYTSVW